ncbi:MAG: hypothetical protein GY906_22870 [bacterium]|nr:hypothetical protein [bacterium]
MPVHRRNPGLVVFNPKELIASDVQAILYRHHEDGELYCHTFGGGETELEQRGDSVTIRNLPESTGVQAEVRQNGRSVVLSHRNGLPVAKEF